MARQRSSSQQWPVTNSVRKYTYLAGHSALAFLQNIDKSSNRTKPSRNQDGADKVHGGSESPSYAS